MEEEFSGSSKPETAVLGGNGNAGGGGVGGGGEDDEQRRCKKKNSSTGWSCKLKAMTGGSLCEKHYLAHLQQRSTSNMSRPENQETSLTAAVGFEGGVGNGNEQVGEKRKPGRPMGSKNKKNKRGKPEQVDQNRKMGKPLGSKDKKERKMKGQETSRLQSELIEAATANQGQVTVDMIVGETVVKDSGTGPKKGGRPKGSKNKEKLHLGKDGNLNVDSGVGGYEAIANASVGETVNENSGMGSKKKGRPKGAQNKKKIKFETDGDILIVYSGVGGARAEDTGIVGQVPLGNVGGGESEYALVKKEDSGGIPNKKNVQGRLKGSRSKKKCIGRPKGSKNKKDLACQGSQERPFSTKVGHDDGNAGGVIKDSKHAATATSEHGRVVGLL